MNQNDPTPLVDEAAARVRATRIPAGPPLELLLTTAAALRRSARPRRRFAAFTGIAAALLIAILLCWALLPDRGSTAWAQVATRVDRTHSLTATFVGIDPHGDGKRLKPHGRLYVGGTRTRMELGDMAVDPEIQVSDRQTGERLMLRPAAKFATRTRGAAEPLDLYDLLRRAVRNPARRLGEETINGRRTVRFDTTFETSRRDGFVERTHAHVWVDSATNLPVRLYTVDLDGATGGGLDDIRFDVPVAAALLDLTPPPGYRTEDRGGLTADQLKPPPTSQQLESLTLHLGRGIGAISFLAPRDRVVTELGPPELTRPSLREGWVDLHYPSLGLVFTFGPEGTLRRLTASAAVVVSDNARDFDGRTDRGVRIGAPVDDVVATYGQPDRVQGERSQGFLTYRQLGATFQIRGGKLAQITMTRPEGPAIRLPISDDARRRAEALVLHPGVGIGDLKFGATRDQTVATLGNPESTSTDACGETLSYPRIGLTVMLGNEGRLREVWADDPNHMANDGNRFPGQTDRGVRIGSLRADVQAACGPPDQDEDAARNAGLNYAALGLFLTLDEDGRVSQIQITAPKPPVTTRPTTNPGCG